MPEPISSECAKLWKCSSEDANSVHTAKHLEWLHVKYLLSMHIHSWLPKMARIETIWELHTLTVINSWQSICYLCIHIMVWRASGWRGQPSVSLWYILYVATHTQKCVETSVMISNAHPWLMYIHGMHRSLHIVYNTVEFTYLLCTVAQWFDLQHVFHCCQTPLIPAIKRCSITALDQPHLHPASLSYF